MPLYFTAWTVLFYQRHFWGNKCLPRYEQGRNCSIMQGKRCLNIALTRHHTNMQGNRCLNIALTHITRICRANDASTLLTLISSSSAPAIPSLHATLRRSLRMVALRMFEDALGISPCDVSVNHNCNFVVCCDA